MELRDGLIFAAGVGAGIALDEGVRYGSKKYDEYSTAREQRLANMVATTANAVVEAKQKPAEPTPTEKVEAAEGAAKS